MKLIHNNSKLQKFFLKRNQRRLRKEKRLSGTKRSRSKNKNFRYKQFEIEIKNKREKFLREFYYPRKRPQGEVVLQITNSFGLEKDLDSFLNISRQISSLDATKISFDLTNCGRIWPSGITVFCSLVHWLSLTRHNTQQVLISSSDPMDQAISSYLSFSGFYDYVGRRKTLRRKHEFHEKHIVKIQKETDRSKINSRETEIMNLVKEYAELTDNEIESFVDNVLIEVFNNVTEHGVSYKDSGWWTISQYHPTSKLISICIADNGIGIKNTLKTGPQSHYLAQRLGRDADDEDFLKEALFNNVSGAVTASVIKDTFLAKGKGERGTRRGQGLKIITDKCKEMNIRFVLLSRKGYIESHNESFKSGRYDSDVFAGTMYHFTIPAKGRENESN